MFAILDGALPSIDRIAADRPYYCGKRKARGMNVQAVAETWRLLRKLRCTARVTDPGEAVFPSTWRRRTEAGKGAVRCSSQFHGNLSHSDAAAGSQDRIHHRRRR